jgi:hypothetical protein
MKECKWKYCCPVYFRAEKGEIDYSWVDNYCSVIKNICVRYHMENDGIPHSDLMLPDGEIYPQ